MYCTHGIGMSGRHCRCLSSWIVLFCGVRIGLNGIVGALPATHHLSVDMYSIMFGQHCTVQYNVLYALPACRLLITFVTKCLKALDETCMKLCVVQ